MIRRRRSCGSGDGTDHAFDGALIALDAAIGVEATEAAMESGDVGKRRAKVQPKRTLTRIA